MVVRMTLSSCNRLKGKITELQLGGVMAHVVIQVGENFIESVITRRSAEEMSLKNGRHRHGSNQVQRSYARKGLTISVGSPDICSTITLLTEEKQAHGCSAQTPACCRECQVSELQHKPRKSCGRSRL